ncbi:MAG: DUF6519 domain-containing protein [Blastocatellia bacterium]
MNGDLSRNTFDQLKHYSRVVMQQGRVQLDADWNEQVAILLHYLQTLAADLIGPHGGPEDIFTNQADREGPIRKNLGFDIRSAQAGEIDTIPFLSDDEKRELKELVAGNASPMFISKGRYYVGGRLCENDRNLLYSLQPDYPLIDAKNLPIAEGKYFEGIPVGQPLLVYLDVWERHITPIEDSAIREVALGGADTAARAKLVCQVKIKGDSPISLPGGDETACVKVDRLWPELVKQFQPVNRGLLRAIAKPTTKQDADDPCITAPDARYRGAENHLYRVEVHKGGTAGTATFKWSRENGSIVAPVLKKQSDNVLIVGGFRDSARWFTDGQWVEMTYDAIDLQGRTGTIFKLMKVDGETLTIDPAKIYGMVFNPAETVKDAAGNDVPKFNHLKVRAWDHQEIGENTLQEGAVKITETESNKYDDGWMELEDGVQIQFVKAKEAPEHIYRTGDYWLIPARIVTGDVEWPEAPDPEHPQIMQAKALPPHGVEHHYAPLAIITLGVGNRVTVNADLRHKVEAQGKCVP